MATDKLELQIKTACVVSIAIGILGAAIVPGRLKSAFSSLCAVVLIFYMISPLAQINTRSIGSYFTRNEKNEEKLLSDVRSAEVMLYEVMLEKSLEQRLADEKLSARLDVICEKDGEEMAVKQLTVSGLGTSEERICAQNILRQCFADADIEFREE